MNIVYSDNLADNKMLTTLLNTNINDSGRFWQSIYDANYNADSDKRQFRFDLEYLLWAISGYGVIGHVRLHGFLYFSYPPLKPPNWIMLR